MAREPKTTQGAPTAPRPVSEAGIELDEWNLPLAGPARAAALSELGKPDPNNEPDAWAAADVKAAAKVEPELTAPFEETDRG